MKNSQNTEITKPVDLCVGFGRLNHLALGWSRRPLVRCNIKDHFFRKKRWDYWVVYNKKHLFSVTVANLDYLGMSFWYFIDFDKQRIVERKVIIPFGVGCKMSEFPGQSAAFASSKYRVQIDRKGQVTELLVEDRREDDLFARFEIIHHDYESLNVVVPWDWNRFQFTSKQFCLSARGEVTLRGESVRFEQDESSAVLDFGRGVWKYKTSWNWANFATKLGDGTVLGINLGAKWTDRTGTNENAILVNGQITKIESDVTFKYDPEDLMKPWMIYSVDSDEVQLEFKPRFVRSSKTNLLILYSQVNQLFGFFKGFVRGENRRIFVIENAFGWAEDHVARW